MTCLSTFSGADIFNGMETIRNINFLKWVGTIGNYGSGYSSITCHTTCVQNLVKINDDRFKVMQTI